MAWAKLLKNKKAETVALIMDKLFQKMNMVIGGYPRLLHCDNGGEFRNEHLQNVCTFKGIRMLHGAPYHSQSQGQIERFNRTIQEALIVYKNSEELKGRADQYKLKTALVECMKYYNNKYHGTTKCTPEEAFQQKFIQTREIQNLSADDIRRRVVENTKRKGQINNQSQIIQFKIGDKILIREKIKAKVRHDGQKLLLPVSNISNRYNIKAKITKQKGSCFDVQFEQDVPALNIRKGEEIPNVPQCLFRKDLLAGKSDWNLETGDAPSIDGKKALSYMDLNCPYISQDKTVISRLGLGKVILKTEATTLSITGEDAEESEEEPKQDHRYSGLPRDQYGRRIKEKRSKWAKIGEEAFGMDVDKVNQQIQNEARIMESKHDWEKAMDST